MRRPFHISLNERERAALRRLAERDEVSEAHAARTAILQADERAQVAEQKKISA